MHAAGGVWDMAAVAAETVETATAAWVVAAASSSSSCISSNTAAGRGCVDSSSSNTSSNAVEERRQSNSHRQLQMKTRMRAEIQSAGVTRWGASKQQAVYWKVLHHP